MKNLWLLFALCTLTISSCLSKKIGIHYDEASKSIYAFDIMPGFWDLEEDIRTAEKRDEIDFLRKNIITGEFDKSGTVFAHLAIKDYEYAIVNNIPQKYAPQMFSYITDPQTTPFNVNSTIKDSLKVAIESWEQKNMAGKNTKSAR